MLDRAKLTTKVAVGTPDALRSVGGSVGRFMKKHGGAFEIKTATADYTPRPGDLYNLLRPNNHAGIVVGVRGDQILTVDGNSGPPDMTRAHDPDGRFGDYQLVNWKTVIGGGMIFKPPQPKRARAVLFSFPVSARAPAPHSPGTRRRTTRKSQQMTRVGR